jgi:hypothetical protein
MSSGQACVLYGIAAFSKDGDWIIQEREESCKSVLNVLVQKGASYRLGAPLDIRWLCKGWTSHFEYLEYNDFRTRVDFVSRPPRIPDISHVWESSFSKHGIEMIDLESLLLIKQTRRPRDYSIIGTLALVCGFNEGNAAIALEYIQDFDNLNMAVKKWPPQAARSRRKAVQLLVSNAPRDDVVSAIAIEQDHLIEADRRRISVMTQSSGEYADSFIQTKGQWSKNKTSLLVQHEELVALASHALKDPPDA